MTWLRKSPVVMNNERGVTLIMVLVAVVIVGLMLTIAGRTWTSQMQQTREEELLFRGDQYRRAIESYYTAKRSYPPDIEALLKDPRSPQVQRHLRQPYKDPFTGDDFELISAGGQVSGSVSAGKALSGFKGVKSASTLKPFKQDGFAAEYERFVGAESYSRWEFIYEPEAQKPGSPVAPPAPTTSTSPFTSSPFTSPAK